MTKVIVRALKVRNESFTEAFTQIRWVTNVRYIHHDDDVGSFCFLRVLFLPLTYFIINNLHKESRWVYFIVLFNWFPSTSSQVSLRASMMPARAASTLFDFVFYLFIVVFQRPLFAWRAHNGSGSSWNVSVPGDKATD
jgi:hypothetical protein